MARWDRLGSRGDVQDRRGMGRPIATVGGLGGLGLIAYLLISLLGGGGSPFDVAPESINRGNAVQSDVFAGEDDYEIFVSTVLGSTDDVWKAIFDANDLVYQPPTLVLFRGATESGCGLATSSVGPHYCPSDDTIYLDETFFDALTSRLGARGGDVAEAYVIAHEVGHHVQNELGTMEAVRTNEASVDLELQADCFAGVWAYHVEEEGVFLPGEIEEAIDAAAAVGDDRIQAQSGRVNPETWTHGSSAQRTAAFTTGFSTGSPAACPSP